MESFNAFTYAIRCGNYGPIYEWLGIVFYMRMWTTSTTTTTTAKTSVPHRRYVEVCLNFSKTHKCKFEFERSSCFAISFFQSQKCTTFGSGNRIPCNNDIYITRLWITTNTITITKFLCLNKPSLTSFCNQNHKFQMKTSKNVQKSTKIL